MEAANVWEKMLRTAERRLVPIFGMSSVANIRHFLTCFIQLFIFISLLLYRFPIKFLGAFAKLRKATISPGHFCTSVRPSALNYSTTTGRILIKFDVQAFLENITYYKYVILIPFPRQLLGERVSMLLYAYITCLVGLPASIVDIGYHSYSLLSTLFFVIQCTLPNQLNL
jgi:hypothetical protein